MAAAATFFFGLLSVIATVQAEESVKVDDLWAGRWSIGRDSGDIKFRLIQTGNNLTGTVLEATGMRHPMEKDLKGEVRGNRVTLQSSDGHKIDAFVKEEEMRGSFHGHGPRIGEIVVKRVAQ